ncbi:Organic cation transporter protein, partial [Armadillidium vulgare]
DNDLFWKRLENLEATKYGNFILLSLPTVVVAMQKLAWVFLAAKMNHSDNGYSQCKLYSIVYEEDPFNSTSDVKACEEFIYDTSEYETSAVIDYNMVCNRAWMRAMVQSFFMVGMLVGSYAFGDFSDRLISESARWLSAKGRSTEAKSVLIKVARANHKQFEDKDVDILSWLVRMVNSGVYYGLSLNTSDLGGNDYINFMISGAVEIPGLLFACFIIEKVGRKMPLCALMSVGGIALLIGILLRKGSIALTVLAMIGMLCLILDETKGNPMPDLIQEKIHQPE